MKAKLITIGDEILIGQIVNTNASFIGERLFSRGISLVKTVVIGDEEKILLDELKDSMQNYDITLITGGLGPTHDDITKPALVKFFNRKPVTDKKVLKHVKKIFSSRNIVMPKINEDQALIPSGSKVMWNANGTAPGICIEKSGKIFIAMPGVPHEMKAIIDNEVLPMLKKRFSGKSKTILLQKTLLTTGIGESTLSELLGNINELIGDARLAFLPSSWGVRMRINVEAKTRKAAQASLKRIEDKIRKRTGAYLYGTGTDSLERITGKLLLRKRKTLSVAESCTGGLLSSKIVSIPGSSKYYYGGVCTYANIEKLNLLNVKRSTLRDHGAVSEETAIEMAKGVRRLMKTDYSLSITGIAGPSGGTREKPVGLVWVGFSSKEKTYALKFLFGNRRDINIERSVYRALEILRRELLKIEIKF